MVLRFKQSKSPLSQCQPHLSIGYSQLAPKTMKLHVVCCWCLAALNCKERSAEPLLPIFVQ